MVPDVITYSSSISALEKGKKPEQALELFQGMLYESVMPNVITYTALISAFAKGKQLERILELLEAMERQGVLGEQFRKLFLEFSCFFL